MPDPRRRRALLSRLVWFAALWGSGVLTVAAIAWLIRLVLQP